MEIPKLPIDSNTTSTLAEKLPNILAQGATAIAILVIGIILAKVVRKAITKGFKKSHGDKIVESFVSNLAYVLIISIAIAATLGRVGVQTTSIVAVLGAAGLAVGLALQGSLSNIASGVLLVIFKHFKAGDYIEGAGAAGTVVEVGLFATTLNTVDNRRIIIPNAKMTDGNIINYSVLPTRRLDLVISVAYSSDLAFVKKTTMELLNADSRVLKDPAPTVAVLNLGESAIDFAVRPWVKSEEYWDLFFDLQEAIKNRYDEVGIEIPFPQRDVHIRSEVKA